MSISDVACEGSHMRNFGRPSLRFLTVSVVGTMEEWDRYRLGHRAVGVLAGTPWLNVQSGHSKTLIQGSSCAALGPHPEKGEDIRKSYSFTCKTGFAQIYKDG